MLYGDEYPHPETEEILLEADEVTSFHIWWWALIRWLSERSDIPVTLPGRTLSDLLHHVLRNMDHYGAFAFIPAPPAEHLSENWPHIRLASIQTIDYVLTLVPQAVREPEADRAVEPVGEILTVAQAAAMLQVSERTVSRMIQRGHLKAAPIQGRGKEPIHRIRRDAVIECLKERERRAKASRS